MLPPAEQCQVSARAALQRKWRGEGRDGTGKESQTLNSKGWACSSCHCGEEGRVRAVTATPGMRRILHPQRSGSLLAAARCVVFQDAAINQAGTGAVPVHPPLAVQHSSLPSGWLELVLALGVALKLQRVVDASGRSSCQGARHWSLYSQEFKM